MKYLIGIAALATLIGTPVLAADMPLKAPPPAPTWSWTGFYLGTEIGGAWARTTIIHGPNDPFVATGITTPLTNPVNSSGALGGFTSGYNYQVGQLLLGYEGDFSFSNLNGTGYLLAPNFNPANSRTVTLENVSTFRGRVGWLPSPQWLIFATGGAAAVEERFTWTSVAGLTQSTDQFAWGYTVGGGIEWRMDRLSFKVEYLHVGLNRIEFDNTALVGGPGFFTTDNLVRPCIDMVRFGINVKIDSLPSFVPGLLPTH